MSRSGPEEPSRPEQGPSPKAAVVKGETEAPRVFVAWVYPSGEVGRGSPLALSAALELLRVYERRYPDRRYWIEEEGLAATRPGGDILAAREEA